MARVVISVKTPGDVLANAIEAQPLISEAHRQQLSQPFKIVQLVPAARRADAIAYAHSQSALAPDLEQCLICGDREVVAARVGHAGDTQCVESTEERARARNLLSECRPRQQIVEVADRPVVCAQPARRMAILVALDGDARGELRNAGEPERV